MKGNKIFINEIKKIVKNLIKEENEILVTKELLRRLKDFIEHDMKHLKDDGGYTIKLRKLYNNIKENGNYIPFEQDLENLLHEMFDFYEDDYNSLYKPNDDDEYYYIPSDEEYNSENFPYSIVKDEILYVLDAIENKRINSATKYIDRF
jgi:hypothetical protein